MSSGTSSSAFWLLSGALALTIYVGWMTNDSKSEFFESSEPGLLNRKCKPRSNKTMGRVEVCLSDIASILEAVRGGADSVEICCARSAGGITPSIGLCEEAVALLKGSKTAINVLIRPREGNFVYNQPEFDVIVRDILNLKRIGVDGIVVGFLDCAGNIDLAQLRIIREVSCGMTLTFHRAFDVCANPSSALEDIISAGCDRLLTSAGCSSAGSPEGITSLDRLCKQANGRIAIVAAAGVSPQNASNITRGAGVYGVHAGSSVTTMKKSCTNVNEFVVSGVNIGSGAASESSSLDSWPVVDASLVSELVYNTMSVIASRS